MEPFSKKSYLRKVEAIFTRFPSVQKVPFKDAYKPGLENMLKFEGVLGNPHKASGRYTWPARTARDSVANMLASALSACGLRVGLYTSPHIVDFRERMRIVGEKQSAGLVSEEYVYDFLCRYEADMDALEPCSFFEITTGMAFKWFYDQKVDVAVIEVGLGGRLDSTNVITPDLSIVTSIALDHCALLGNTLAEIAAEKAGISRRTSRPLSGSIFLRHAVFEAKSAEVGCPLTSSPRMPSRRCGTGAMQFLRDLDLRGEYRGKTSAPCSPPLISKEYP